MGRKLGTVVVSPAVLGMISRLTALSVPGVVRMGPLGVRRLLGAYGRNGVKVQFVDEAVVLDVYIIAATNVNMLELSREIQAKVTRAIHDIMGMAVREVNIHIVDVLDAEESVG